MKTVKYSHLSDLRTPKRFVVAAVGDLKNSFSLGWRIYSRDFKVQYREALFGILWMLLPALGIIGPFVLAENANLIQIDTKGSSYVLFLTVSVTIWQLFLECFQAPLVGLNKSKGLITKVKFPFEAVIMAYLFEALINFLVRLFLVAVVFIILGVVPPVTAALLPVGIVVIAFMGLALGLLIVPLGMLYQDIIKSLPLIGTAWMFITPVIYPPPEQGVLSVLIKLNPVAAPVITIRDWLIGTSSGYEALTFYQFGVTVIVCVIGWVVTRVSMPFLIERAGN
jgi:lipopolysaccharide transport system permease protein